MSPYMIYQMAQAEQAEQCARSISHSSRCGDTAQRQADARLGELAAAVAQCFHGPGFRRPGFHRLGFRGLRVRALRRRLARETP